MCAFVFVCALLFVVVYKLFFNSFSIHRLGGFQEKHSICAVFFIAYLLLAHPLIIIIIINLKSSRRFLLSCFYSVNWSMFVIFFFVACRYVGSFCTVCRQWNFGFIPSGSIDLIFTYIHKYVLLKEPPHSSHTLSSLFFSPLFMCAFYSASFNS